jgi:hypothetical protein
MSFFPIENTSSVEPFTCCHLGEAHRSLMHPLQLAGNLLASTPVDEYQTWNLDQYDKKRPHKKTCTVVVLVSKH